MSHDFEWIPEDLRFKIIRMYVEGVKAYDGEIADEYRKRYPHVQLGEKKFTQTQIGQLITDNLKERGIELEARDDLSNTDISNFVFEVVGSSDFVRFVPPAHDEARRKLAALVLASAHQIVVVESRGTPAASDDQGCVIDDVARRAADVGLDLIKKVAKTKPEVHLGIGSGRTSRLICKYICVLLRDAQVVEELSHVELVVHALSAGFDPQLPLSSPVASFSMFQGIPLKTRFVALFAPSIVEFSEFQRVIELPGIKESFERKDEIDIVFSSLAGKDNKQGLWLKYANAYPGTMKALEREEWVGDFQFRPFSVSKPIVADTICRAVTLFEIADFVRIAASAGKHVVLVSGPSKELALVPLLTQPELRVWDYFVCDVLTAEKLATLI